MNKEPTTNRPGFFFADKQTLDDLNIPGRHKNNSIARLFDVTITAGGRKLMDQMFQQPLINELEINKRSAIFRYFGELDISFPFTVDEFSIVENYLTSGSYRGIFSSGLNITLKKVLQLSAGDKGYEMLHVDVCRTIDLLNRFGDFIERLPVCDVFYSEQKEKIRFILNHHGMRWLKYAHGRNELTLIELIKYDHQLRSEMYDQMRQLIDIMFHLDVYIAVSHVGKQHGYTYAKALPKKANTITIANLYHPTLKNAIGNAVRMHNEQNVLFLTGANMAGKSTLMKSFGISIYLAHMGFPVAASNMEFSVKDGLYTSINVPDSLDQGHSHFYAEVMRVKTVANQVAAGKDLFVIFDELFKGTNVKDAYDATHAITEAFSEIETCFFIISTHIIEVGMSLKMHRPNFRFAYLPTVMDGLIPRYTYLLEDGITADRQGMIIIENEGILGLIK